MNQITKETRLESYLSTNPNTRQREILGALGDKELTARQIANILGYKDLNNVKPRLSEMLADGRVEATGKAFDEVTKRHVTVFRRV